MSVCVYVCVYALPTRSKRVCVRERVSEREFVYVCVRVYQILQTGSKCVCVRERERERERERVCACV